MAVVANTGYPGFGETKFRNLCPVTNPRRTAISLVRHHALRICADLRGDDRSRLGGCSPHGRAGSQQEAAVMRIVQYLLALVALVATQIPSARAAEEVDLVLALAMDVSRSMDQPKFLLQRQGYAAAIADPQVLSAIRHLARESARHQHNRDVRSVLTHVLRHHPAGHV